MGVVQLNFGGEPGNVCRSDKPAKPPKLSEAALQAQIRQTLGVLGYSTAEVGSTRARVTCKKCGHNDWPAGWQGNSVGVPDLLVFRHDLPAFPPVAMFVEVKTGSGAVRPAQAVLAAAGRSVIVRSVGDAVRAVQAAEEAMTAYVTPAAQVLRLADFLAMNEGRI